MPSKGSKAAARQRQAQQRNRKRRGGARGRGQEFDPGPSESRTSVAIREPEVEEEEGTSQPRPVAARPAAVAQRPVRRGRQRGQSSDPLIYRYISGELRQITIISVLMGIILAVLTFVLGG